MQVKTVRRWSGPGADREEALMVAASYLASDDHPTQQNILQPSILLSLSLSLSLRLPLLFPRCVEEDTGQIWRTQP